MKLVFLYTRYASYFHSALNSFLDLYSDYSAVVIRYKPDLNAPLKFGSCDKITIISKDDFNNEKDLTEYVVRLNPVLVYTAGWSDKSYRTIAKLFYGKIPTLVGLDNPWEGNTRQLIGVLYFRIFWKRIFSNIWVAGPPQEKFALRLGYKNFQILNGLYACDEDAFCKQGEFQGKRKELLFVGRFVPYKQPDILFEVFNQILSEELNNGWSLRFIGNGPLKAKLEAVDSEYINVEGFIQPEELPDKMRRASAFCLPSKGEHWGVVVHEAVSCGLPLVLSNTTFSSSLFLEEGKNGFSFLTDQRESLRDALINLFNRTETELCQMSDHSLLLSRRVSKEKWAENLKKAISG